jgi:hypothetical protein
MKDRAAIQAFAYGLVNQHARLFPYKKTGSFRQQYFRPARRERIEPQGKAPRRLKTGAE